MRIEGRVCEVIAEGEIIGARLQARAEKLDQLPHLNKRVQDAYMCYLSKLFNAVIKLPQVGRQEVL